MFRRHDLLIVDPEMWPSVLARLPAHDEMDMLPEWAKLGRPVIVRRRFPGESEEDLPVGVQLPRSAGQRRVALRLPRDAVISRLERPDIAAAIPDAPAAWHPTLTALLAVPALAEPARVFGSLLWQCVTGLPYLREQSDLDLTFPCAGDPFPVATAIAAIDLTAHPRIDGELLLADGSACHWREVADEGVREVLLKTDHGVELRPRSALTACARAPA
ncbi:MAG TPA: malonate decarboxylase holo-[acyl-carrier-protein] synthase [Acidisoma sp.]|jgi:phosphoribosyl-dephospho-CoA transferase|nr:malonate decarboxylase holo-[acyl-carrier-protein] synthase [Acidisoma sp.]